MSHFRRGVTFQLNTDVARNIGHIRAGFHQLLNIHKDKQPDCWGFKIKGWWRKGDIRTTKPKKSFECWVKTAADVPTEAKESLMETLMVPQQNVGKDEYTVDLEGNEKLY